MRGLVYAVKDNRQPPNPPQAVEHPFHPAPDAIRIDRHNAIEYVATIAGAMRSHLLRYFDADDASAVTLVPVPSSEVTLATQSTARFPTLRLCHALAAAGLGTVAVLALQRRAVEPRTRGNRRDLVESRDNLIRTASALPRAGTVVLVDDNVRSGASMAALDHLLGATRACAIFAVAVTDASPCADACRPRRFSLRYQPSDLTTGVERILQQPVIRRRRER
jgi:hypothetical protein